MSITIVSTPSTPTPSTSTDSGNDATSGQDFANLLQGQIATDAARPTVLPQEPADLPVAATADSTAADTTDAADPASLLATLGLVVAPAGAAPTVAAPAAAKPVDTKSGDDATTDAAPVDSASLLAALGISIPPTSTPTAPASTSDSASSASLTAVSAGTGQGSPVDNRGQSLIAEAAPAVTTLVDDKAAKFAVASANVENTAATEITATDSPALLVSSASGGTHNVALRNDSTLSVATPVRDRDWASDVGQKIVWLATNDKHSAQLTLNPEHMGPIEISLSVDKGNASVSFISANAEVRDALETALPKLREMFASAGIELGQTNVSSESFRQQGGNGEPNQSSSRSTADNAILAGNTVASLQVKAFSAQQGNGLVNTFA